MVSMILLAVFDYDVVVVLLRSGVAIPFDQRTPFIDHTQKLR